MTIIRRGAFAVAVLVAATLLATIGSTASGANGDVTIASSDGTKLAATLRLPTGTPPAGGWPAVIFLHGLGGDRSSTLAVADSMGIGDRFAILAFDARGHGQSEGLITIDGPKEIADVRSVFTWLAGRPDISDTKIGGWGISYGGGALWLSLAAGVPWATIEPNMTWTDLGAALVPQDLVKSGVVAGFIGSLPSAKIDPEVTAIADAAFAGTLGPVRPWAGARSPLDALKGVTTPVFMSQGRRDFAFGLEQATRVYTRLAGPKRLWIGLHGHAPSSFPAPDTGAMLAEEAQWFDRYLRLAPAPLLAEPPVAVAPADWRGTPKRLSGLPAVRLSAVPFSGARRTIASTGRVQRTSRPLGSALEVFGSPTVVVRATAAKGWSRIVAVLSATTPAGAEIVVAGGGVPTRAGARRYVIKLGDQATFLPKGSRLTLTIASTSLRQNPGNLLYLDLPLASGARLTVAQTRVTVPTLKTPVSR